MSSKYASAEFFIFEVYSQAVFCSARFLCTAWYPIEERPIRIVREIRVTGSQLGLRHAL